MAPCRRRRARPPLSPTASRRCRAGCSTLATAVVAIALRALLQPRAGRHAAVPDRLSGRGAGGVAVGHRLGPGRGARVRAGGRPCPGSRRRSRRRPPDAHRRLLPGGHLHLPGQQPARARERRRRAATAPRPASTRRWRPGCARCCGARVLVPLTAFVAASWWGYERAVAEARGRAPSAPRRWCAARPSAPSRSPSRSRTAPTRPRAATTRRVRAREAEIHARLADMVAGLPSVVNLNVWDAQRPADRAQRPLSDRPHRRRWSDRAYFLQQTHAPRAAGHQRRAHRAPDRACELLNATIRRRRAGRPLRRHRRGVAVARLLPRLLPLAGRREPDAGALRAGAHRRRDPGRLAAADPADGAARAARRRGLRARARRASAHGHLEVHVAARRPAALRQLPARGRLSAVRRRGRQPRGDAGGLAALRRACWPRCWCR